MHVINVCNVCIANHTTKTMLPVTNLVSIRAIYSSTERLIEREPMADPVSKAREKNIRVIPKPSGEMFGVQKRHRVVRIEGQGKGHVIVKDGDMWFNASKKELVDQVVVIINACLVHRSNSSGHNARPRDGESIMLESK
jgi:hypothetical protein